MARRPIIPSQRIVVEAEPPEFGWACRPWSWVPGQRQSIQHADGQSILEELTALAESLRAFFAGVCREPNDGFPTYEIAGLNPLQIGGTITPLSSEPGVRLWSSAALTDLTFPAASGGFEAATRPAGRSWTFAAADSALSSTNTLVAEAPRFAAAPTDTEYGNPVATIAVPSTTWSAPGARVRFRGYGRAGIAALTAFMWMRVTLTGFGTLFDGRINDAGPFVVGVTFVVFSGSDPARDNGRFEFEIDITRLSGDAWASMFKLLTPNDDAGSPSSARVLSTVRDLTGMQPAARTLSVHLYTTGRIASLVELEADLIPL